MSYNVLYQSLPTFNQNSIGYIDPSSQVTYTYTTPIDFSGNVYTTFTTFNSVPPGVYIFNLSGYYQADNGSNFNTYLSTNSGIITPSGTIYGIHYGFSGSSNANQGGVSLCNVFPLSSPTTLYLVGYSSTTPGNVSFNGTFSLCRIA